MRNSLALGVLAVLQLVASLAGQVAVFRFVGIGAVSDAWVAAQAVPMILTAVIATSLQGLWLPKFVRAVGDEAAFRNEQAAAQGQVIKSLSAISLLLWASSLLWARLLFPAFSEIQVTLVVLLGGPLFVSCVLNAQCGLLTAALRAKGAFLRAELAALMAALVALAMIGALVPRFGIVAAAWIALGRSAVVYLLQYLLAHQPGVRMLRTESADDVWKQARPMVGAALFIKSGPLVDRFWSAQGGNGAATTFNLAYLAIGSLVIILERAILVRVAPEFTRRLNARDYAGLKRIYVRSLRDAALAVAAIAIGLFLLWPLWREVLVLSMRMSTLQADQMLLMCAVMLPVLFVGVGGASAAAVFYAFGEARVPARIGIVGFLAGLVFKALLFIWFGIVGLAAGVSAYVIVVMLLYDFAVRRHIYRARENI